MITKRQIREYIKAAKMRHRDREHSGKFSACPRCRPQHTIAKAMEAKRATER
jgi:uncharacterized C2H2 Zn-finger protein